MPQSPTPISPSEDLDQALQVAAAAEPGTRIDFRDRIAAHGSDAIEAMRDWVGDPRLAAFAIRVLERTAIEPSQRAAVLDVLDAIDRDNLPSHLVDDVDRTLAVLGRKPRAPRTKRSPADPTRRAGPGSRPGGMSFGPEPVIGIRYMTPAQVSRAVEGFSPGYADDWAWWLTVPARRRPVVLGQILRRWQATRPQPMRRPRAEASHSAPYLEDLYDDAQRLLGILGDVDVLTIRARTQEQDHALRAIWANFARLAATGEASCVGITKAVLLVTDGRVGPAFDSNVRQHLRIDRPKSGVDWLTALDLIADDIAEFEARHGPLENVVPHRFGHLSVGRLYDMALGPRGD